MKTNTTVSAVHRDAMNTNTIVSDSHRNPSKSSEDTPNQDRKRTLSVTEQPLKTALTQARSAILN